jgi:hypothetical protein
MDADALPEVPTDVAAFQKSFVRVAPATYALAESAS